MAEQSFEHMHVEGGAPVKMWTRGVAVDVKARDQLSRAAQMPFIFKHVAVMPDVHVGIGATVGSVIPTIMALIPAAVGVDIGCGVIGDGGRGDEHVSARDGSRRRLFRRGFVD